MARALALLASASRREALLDWLDRQSPAVAGFPLLASAELAAAIRAESVAVELDVLRAALLDSVVDKLQVANPKYLES